jgi:hypothetical protein
MVEAARRSDGMQLTRSCPGSRFPRLFTRAAPMVNRQNCRNLGREWQDRSGCRSRGLQPAARPHKHLVRSDVGRFIHLPAHRRRPLSLWPQLSVNEPSRRVELRQGRRSLAFISTLDAARTRADWSRERSTAFAAELRSIAERPGIVFAVSRRKRSFLCRNAISPIRRSAQRVRREEREFLGSTLSGVECRNSPGAQHRTGYGNASTRPRDARSGSVPPPISTAFMSRIRSTSNCEDLLVSVQ